MSKHIQGFRSVPKTGVIYVMSEAMKRGYHQDSPDWVNFGQGAPETGPLPGAHERLHHFEFTDQDLEYAPVVGLTELRQAVADLYNERYRKGKSSQYTYENVAISSGGRLALTRLVSTLGRVNVGHFIPDYTAYEELLDAFGTFVPIPIPLKPERGYAFDVRELEEQILSFGLSAVLLSNPCNPTGKLIASGALNAWVAAARKLSCNLIIDEFYSHYIYSNAHLSVSAAQYVEDVNSDPVVIIDGLTKNWRYPGFRISWTVAPKEIIDGIASAGSFLDGGAARPMQLAALSLVKKEIADREARAIQQAFSKKRALLVRGLSDMGISVTPEPEGGFYCWGDLSFLPEELNNGWKLFSRALEVGVIIVPGTFFDINPGHRRGGHKSRFESFARFSFGPPEAELELGIEKLSSLLNRG